jgi:molybdenum cofactor biosynthesis enzyme MoaA
MSAVAFPLQSKPVPRSFAPEQSPYDIVMVDVTHRCNMTCANCYLPNRILPDIDARWLSSMFSRLRKGTFIRLTGGEATLRHDLPDIIRDVRKHGHHPVVMTNGLKLHDRAYVRELKQAGMQVCYLSFSGGFDDDLYEAIDEMRCAEKKRLAFENLRAEHVFTSIGMILVPGLNESAITATWKAIERGRNVRELHLRAVGAMGRHMTTPPAKLDQMMTAFCDAAGATPESIELQTRTGITRQSNAQEFFFGRVHVQMTEWPDLGSSRRGRLTPEGLVAPFMEHIIANDGGY